MHTDDTRLIKRYEKQISELDMQKEDLEIDLSKLRIANGIRYTKEDIVAWLKVFCKGDLLDEEFQKRIIDVFINSVYVYDDKIVIYYNIKNGKQISYIDNCEALDEADTETIESNGERESVRISNLTPRQIILYLRCFKVDIGFIFVILLNYLSSLKVILLHEKSYICRQKSSSFYYRFYFLFYSILDICLTI